VDETKFFLVTEELEAISSTEIRNLLKTGGNLEHLMHPAAAQYLRENVTYKEGRKGEGKEVREEEARDSKEDRKGENNLAPESKTYLRSLMTSFYCSIL
jgi:hypothetical protein